MIIVMVSSYPPTLSNLTNSNKQENGVKRSEFEKIHSNILNMKVRYVCNENEK